jgi:hypothetical protein
MHGARKVLVALYALASAACASSVELGHEASPDADFARYETFAWAAPPGPPAAPPGAQPARRADDGRIRAAIEAELEARGYRPAPAASADLLVSYAVGTTQRETTQAVAGRGTVVTPRPGSRSWERSPQVRTVTSTAGVLSIELVDRAKGAAVWVGWASKRLTTLSEPEPLIRRAVDEILAQLPARR